MNILPIPQLTTSIVLLSTSLASSSVSVKLAHVLALARAAIPAEHQVRPEYNEVVDSCELGIERIQN